MSDRALHVLGAIAFTMLISTAANAATDLIYSSHGGSSQWNYCYGKSDSTAVPTDPRSLVQPGVSDGRAVSFNAFWKDCHVDPVAVQEEGHAKTCGELRARFYHGNSLLDTGAPGVGALFTGNDPTTVESVFGTSTLTAAQYNALWTTGEDSCSAPTTSTRWSPSATARCSAAAPIPTRSRSRTRTGPMAEPAACRRCSPSCARTTASGAGASASPATLVTAAR